MKGWRIVGLGMMAVCMMQFTAWAESRSTDSGFVGKVRDQAEEEFHRYAAVSRLVRSDLVRQGGEAYASAAMWILQRPDAAPVIKSAILNNLYGDSNPQDILQWLKIEPNVTAATLRHEFRLDITAEDIINSGKVIDPTLIPRVPHVGNVPTSAPAPGFGRATDCMNQKMADAGFAGGIPGGGVTDPVASAGMLGESGGMGQQGPIGKQTPGKPGLGATAPSAAGLCGAVDWGKMDKGGTIGKEGDTWSVNTGKIKIKATESGGKMKGTITVKGEYGTNTYRFTQQLSENDKKKGEKEVTVTDAETGEKTTVTVKHQDDASQTNQPDDGSTPPTATATRDPNADVETGKSAQQACEEAYNDCTSDEEKAAKKGKEDCLNQFGGIKSKVNGPVAMPSPDGGGFNVDQACGGSYAGLDTTKMPNFGLTNPNPMDTGDAVSGPGKLDCSTPDPLGKPKLGCGPGSGGGIPGGPGGGGGGPTMMPTTTLSNTATPSLWQNLVRMGSGGRAGTRGQP